MYYKNIENAYIVSISKGAGDTGITEAEYRQILSLIRSAPAAPDGYIYLLRADTLEWKLAENPPEPEPPEDEDIDEAEAYNIIFGGGEA